MKIKSLFIVAFILLFVPVVVSAQNSSPSPEPVEEEFDYNRAYQDYVFTLNVYQNEHGEYTLARSQYLQAGTLVAQTKAQEETAEMLEARDDVVATYLTALRMRLLEAEGVSDIEKNSLFDRLDAEIAWFKDHKERISSAGNLNDLVNDSDEAAKRFSEARPLIYEVLSIVPIGKVSVLRAEQNILLNRLKDKTFEIRSNGDHDTQIVERWIIETDEKITRSVDKEIEAQTKVALFGGETRRLNLEGNYNQVVNLVRESHQFLREASKFMREIIMGLTTVQ